MKRIVCWFSCCAASAVANKPDRFASVGKTIPYGWMVSGVPTVMRGALAEEIQKQKAKRIGGGCVAFPIYRDVA